MFDDGYTDYCRFITAKPNDKTNPMPMRSICGCLELLELDSNTGKSPTKNTWRNAHQNLLKSF